MKRRRYHLPPPPADVEYIVGEAIEFAPEDDRVNAGKPLPPTVELTPVGPPAVVIEFTPEDDLVSRGDRASKRRLEVGAQARSHDSDAAVGMADTIYNLGSVRWQSGRPNEAMVCFEQAVATYRQLAQDRPGVFELNIAVALNSLGKVLCHLERFAEAEECFEEALMMYRRLT